MAKGRPLSVASELVGGLAARRTSLTGGTRETREASWRRLEDTGILSPKDLRHSPKLPKPPNP